MVGFACPLCLRNGARPNELIQRCASALSRPARLLTASRTPHSSPLNVRLTNLAKLIGSGGKKCRSRSAQCLCRKVWRQFAPGGISLPLDIRLTNLAKLIGASAKKCRSRSAQCYAGRCSGNSNLEKRVSVSRNEFQPAMWSPEGSRTTKANGLCPPSGSALY